MKSSKDEKKQSTRAITADEGEMDHVLSSLTPDIVNNLDDEFIDSLQDIADAPRVSETHRHDVDIADIDLDFDINEANDREMPLGIPHASIDTREHIESNDSNESTFMSQSRLDFILSALRSNSKAKCQWDTINTDELAQLFKDENAMEKNMTKREINTCFEAISSDLKEAKIVFYKSWLKGRLIHLMYSLSTSEIDSMAHQKTNKRRKTAAKLQTICRKVLNGLPKCVLNAIFAENMIIDRINTWKRESPFSYPTTVSNIGDVMWFSTPEFNPETNSYVFSFLDMHHLLTNCRVKVCKDGFPDRDIKKEAWLQVARENSTNLKLSHVEDLVDKQSDAIARETFSKDVQIVMTRLGFNSEATFCKLVREFYEAEDDPGLSVLERCKRRLDFRSWLLTDVSFTTFPPYGSHIKGIPNIMFQGFLTNIDRRIQLFPFIKSGSYNVRSLGTLEAENLFGEFQDLDPKGSGVIRAEEVSSALETACQLLKTQMDPDRPFHMSLSKAKVYPVREMLKDLGSREKCEDFAIPLAIQEIFPKDHMFDSKLRAKRKPKRRQVGIAKPGEAARGVAPVRQYHKCDESKILPHKRLGIDLH